VREGEKGGKEGRKQRRNKKETNAFLCFSSTSQQGHVAKVLQGYSKRASQLTGTFLFPPLPPSPAPSFSPSPPFLPPSLPP